MNDTTLALISAPILVAALLAVPLAERAALAGELGPIVCLSEATIGAEGLSQGCDPFALAGATVEAAEDTCPAWYGWGGAWCPRAVRCTPIMFFTTHGTKS